jgi:hypothetical protein
MGVNGQCHTLTAVYPQGKDPRYPEPVWTQGLEEKSSAPVEDRTSIAQSSSP